MSQKEYAKRLTDIKELASIVFQDDEAAENWLNTHNQLLNSIPRTLLDTEKGFHRIKEILMRIEYGMYS